MSFPNFTFWSHLLATVGVEVCCLAAPRFCGATAFSPGRLATGGLANGRDLPAAAAGLGVDRFGPRRGRDSPWPKAGGGKRAGIRFHGGQFRSYWRAGGGEVESFRPRRRRPAAWWPGWVWLAGTAIILGRMAAAQVLLLAMRLRREKISTHSLRERVVPSRPYRAAAESRFVAHAAARSVRWRLGFAAEHRIAPGIRGEIQRDGTGGGAGARIGAFRGNGPAVVFAGRFAPAPLLWWHPLAWWVRRSLHLSAELAADEATVPPATAVRPPTRRR